MQARPLSLFLEVGNPAIGGVILGVLSVCDTGMLTAWSSRGCAVRLRAGCIEISGQVRPRIRPSCLIGPVDDEIFGGRGTT